MHSLEFSIQIQPSPIKISKKTESFIDQICKKIHNFF